MLCFLMIAVIAELTLVDLFATQGISPGLTARDRLSPATMGATISACIFGMAAASPFVALFADRIDQSAPLAAASRHLADPRLRSAFGFGFCIFFVFIGVFTDVNFELAGPRFGLSMMALASVCSVFPPSILTTAQAGALAGRFGLRRATWAGLCLALAGVGLMMLDWLPAALLGMALVAVGTFLAEALATGSVSRAASGDRAAASGLYLACHFSGDLIGAILLGQV